MVTKLSTRQTADSSSKIRKAVAEDLHDCIYIGKRFAKESGYEKLKVNVEKAEATFWSAIEREDTLLLVVESEGQVVGVFLAMLAPAFFTDVILGVELMWYVLPEYRGKLGDTPIRILDEYEKWAKAGGASMINMVNIDLLNGEKVAKIYKAKGYRLTENTFVKEI